jgi:hypothetical protein
MRILLHISTLAILLTFAFILPPEGLAQDLNNLKAGVVRIQNNRTNEVGTGFIVRIDGREIYIITASHVVRGDQHPRIYLFNQPRDGFQGELLDREDDETKGLALVRAKVDSKIASGITSLRFSQTSQLSGGEDIRIIGFPDGVAFWTVGSGTVARIEGRNLVFSGSIRAGNSGGPVILNGLVLGLVTDVTQASAYAARAEVIEPYVNGVVPNLIKIVTDPPRNEFCQTLKTIVDSSRNGFYEIVGAPTNSENTFNPRILLPGARYGYVLPKERVFYNFLDRIREKATVESEFYAVVSKVRACMPNWEESEKSDTSYRYHIFKTGQGSTVVRVYFNVTSQRENYFFLTFSIDLSLRVPPRVLKLR